MRTIRLPKREDAVPAALLATLLFLTVASMVIGKAARDAIFLSRFTVLEMTAIDLGTMVAILLAVAAQLRLNAWLSTRRLLLVSPVCFALGDFALWLGLSTPRGAWIAWVLYLWIGVQAALSAPHAFVLASRVLNIGQVRRLCGPIACGATLGGIGGGLATGILAARLGAASMLLAASLLTALCPVIVAMAWRERNSGGTDPPGSLRQCASLVWTSRHLRALACLAFTSSAVTSIAGLQFKAIASQSIHSPEHLAAFFGSFSLGAGLVALAVQALVTPRVLNRLGLSAALTIAPAALVAASLGVLFSETLIAVVILRGSDQILRHSVDRPAVDLLYRPLPPRHIFEGRMVIDAIVCRLGDAAGALAAFAGVAVFHWSFPFLSVIGVVAIAAWLAAAALAGRGCRKGPLERLRPYARLQAPERGAIRRGGAADWRGLSDPDAARRLEPLRALTRARDPSSRTASPGSRLATATRRLSRSDASHHDALVATIAVAPLDQRA